jgi:hypothetical protein
MADYREYSFSGIVDKPYKAGKLENTLCSIITGKDN